MSKSFKAALRSIVGKLEARFREQGEQDMRTLLDAGGTTFKRARELCVDSTAPPKVREIACWTLGRLGDKGATASITRALHDADPGVRTESAHALGELKSTEAIQPLVDALLRDPSDNVRCLAAWSLGRIGNATAMDPLIRALADPEQSPRLRGECAEALGELGQQAALTPLLHALGDASAEVRFFAAFALGMLGDPRAQSKLEELAKADEGVAEGWGSVREEAAAALEAIRAAAARQ
jgi:HEAT repeat protein